MVRRCAIIGCHFLPEMRDALLHGAGIPGIFFPIYCTVLQKNVKGSGIFGQFGKIRRMVQEKTLPQSAAGHIPLGSVALICFRLLRNRD
jgi:hypothetical protein